MIKPWHIIAFVVALLAFAIWRAPITLAVHSREGGLTFAAAEGTVWDARLRDAAWAGLPAGDATWRLNGLDLLQGVLTARIDAPGPGAAGGLTVRRNLAGDRTIGAYEVKLQGVPVGGTMLAGETTLRDLDLRFKGDQCTVAQGTADSDVLARNAEAFGGWTGPEIGGSWACAGDVAQLTLRGADASGAVSVQISLRANGEGAWRAEALPAAANAFAGLAVAGFAQGAGGAMRGGGEFQWATF